MAKDNGFRCICCLVKTELLLIICTGYLLLKRLLIAIPQAIQTHHDFVSLNASLKAVDPEEFTAMEQALEAWEADKTQPDPYRLPKSSKSRVRDFVC